MQTELLPTIQNFLSNTPSWLGGLANILAIFSMAITAWVALTVGSIKSHYIAINRVPKILEELGPLLVALTDMLATYEDSKNGIYFRFAQAKSVIRTVMRHTSVAQRLHLESYILWLRLYGVHQNEWVAWRAYTATHQIQILLMAYREDLRE